MKKGGKRTHTQHPDKRCVEQIFSLTIISIVRQQRLLHRREKKTGKAKKLLKNETQSHWKNSNHFYDDCLALFFSKTFVHSHFYTEFILCCRGWRLYCCCCCLFVRYFYAIRRFSRILVISIAFQSKKHEKFDRSLSIRSFTVSLHYLFFVFSL